METSSNVQFSLSRNGISVSAAVSSAYFSETVMPVITSLLKELTEVTAGVQTAASLPNVAAKPSGGPPLDLSVKAIAQQLGAKSCSDVLRAAAASLALVQRKDQFSWKELLAEAQKAGAYWTKSHSTNSTKGLRILQTSGVLKELANGNLTLSPTAEEELVSLLIAEAK